MGDCLVLRLLRSVTGVVLRTVTTGVRCGFEAVDRPARRRPDVRG